MMFLSPGQRSASLGSLVWLAGGCTPEPQAAVVVARAAGDSGQADPTGPMGLLLEQSDWTVQGRADGLQPLDGGGWRVERADGAALELHEGWLVLQTLVLEACPEDEPAARRTPPPHGPTTHPSAAAAPVALDLRTLAPLSVAGGQFQVLDACAVGVGAFRADESTVGLPEDGILDGRTLYVAGRLRRDAAAGWEPWEMHSGLSAEVDLALDPAGWDPDTTAAHLTLTVSPAHLLDGVDLDQHPERVALAALAPLLATTTVALSPGAP